MKIDVLDKKILFCLDQNSRQTYTRIAKQVGASKEVVRYRFKRMQDAGLFVRFLTIMNTAVLGRSEHSITIHKILFATKGIGPDQRDELVGRLAANPRTIWTVEADGRYDIGLNLHADDLRDLDDAMREIMEWLSPYIRERTISTNLHGEYFPRRYLWEDGKARNSPAYGQQHAAQLDEIDWKILLYLAGSARIQPTELAEELAIGADAVRKRIRSLEESGVIQGYTVVLNHSVLDQLHYKIPIYFDDYAPEAFERLRGFCMHHPRVVYLIKSIGEWDAELDVELSSVDEYREFMRELYAQLSGVIRQTDPLNIYKIHEYRYLPDADVIV